MESKEQIILNPEDFQDYHKLARKIFGASPKGGRPSKEEAEFKEYLKDLYQFRLAKESGLLDAFMGNLKQPEGRTPRDRSRPTEGLFQGILKGDFSLAELFTEETLQETIKTGLVQFGPLIALIGGLWVAEKHIKIPIGKDKEGNTVKGNFPPILHTSFNILIQVLRLTDVLATFFATGLGGITDFLTDPVGSVIEGTQDAIGVILGIDPDETTEERAERHKKTQQEVRAKIESRGGRFGN